MRLPIGKGEADQVQTEMEEMAKRIAEEAAARQDRLAAAERLDGEALVQEKKLSALQAQIADLERERVSAQRELHCGQS